MSNNNYEVDLDSKTSPENLRMVCHTDMLSIRQLCINRNYYTCGDVKAYDKMLRKADSLCDVTVTDLHWLALDIKAHSDTPDTVEDIMQGLYFNACRKFLSY